MSSAVVATVTGGPPPSIRLSAPASETKMLPDGARTAWNGLSSPAAICVVCPVAGCIRRTRPRPFSTRTSEPSRLTALVMVVSTTVLGKRLQRSALVGLGRPELAHVERAELGDGMPGRDRDGLGQAVALQHVEAGDQLLRLREGAVGDERLAAAQPDD